MVAAVYIFFLLFWVYGVVPHEFLTWADTELGVAPAKKIIGPEGSLGAVVRASGRTSRSPIDKQNIRDIVAVAASTASSSAGYIWFWSCWQDQGERPPRPPLEQPVSPLRPPAGQGEA